LLHNAQVTYKAHGPLVSFSTDKEIFLNFLFLGKEFSMVQREVSSMIKGRLLVGHAIHHDLQV
jgi:hypothetical protein